MATFEFPLTPEAQGMNLAISGVEYTFRFAWSESPDGGWIMDISTRQGAPLLRGVPLTAGQNVLGQFDYLGIPGAIYVQTDSNPMVEPTYGNLGISGKVLFVTP